MPAIKICPQCGNNGTQHKCLGNGVCVWDNRDGTFEIILDDLYLAPLNKKSWLEIGDLMDFTEE